MATRHDEFERTLLSQSRSLLRVAYRLTASAADAEDLVQETLLLAWRSFHRFRPNSNARAWLFRILFNSFYAQGRKHLNTPAMVSFDSAADPSSVDHSVSDSMDVAKALNTLPVEHRGVLMLGIVEGFTCREMADILSLPIGTVMSRLSRARQSLRGALTPSAKYAGKESS